MRNYRQIEACRISKSKHLISVLNLGFQALTGVFPRDSSVEVTHDARHQYKALNNLVVKVFAFLHPDISSAFQKQLFRNSNIEYYDYSDNKKIRKAYKQALFSVFPSYYEGFGLPIVESLEKGVPCLTANFGAMAEAASGGGCYLVDVLDDTAICNALVKLTTDESLRNELRGQIKSRTSRTWIDYAKDIVDLLTKCDDRHIQLTNELRGKISDWLNKGNADASETFISNKITINLININFQGSSDYARSADLGDRRTVLTIAKLIQRQEQQELSSKLLELIANSDILLVQSDNCMDKIIHTAKINDLQIPLPYHVLTGEHTYVHSLKLAIDLYLKKIKAMVVKSSENLLAAAYSYSNVQSTQQPYELAVVISTYNRADFVAMNVEWIIKQISSKKLPVVCIVVDNTSTDDTYFKLSKFFKHPPFRYICNTANVGMLGNLQVCSCLDVSKYMWIICDDDFIAQGSIARTLDIIKENPRIPFVFHNFAVYYREKVSPFDSPNVFIHKGTPIEKKTSCSGTYPIYEIAGEHDNLFTAIYPIVFRSDLAAACFNYPFNGIPFSSLIESIPTTKFILGSYSGTRAYWMEHIGVVGNGHNSWNIHRPRWHMVLMPEALALARDVGVDPKKIWRWFQIHKGLFYEAIEIAMAKGTPVRLNSDDFKIAYRLFREKITVPENLKKI